jgi:hypothetical protein
LPDNHLPGSVGGEYHNYHLGVWYSFANQWAIFNQDITAMPVGAKFNVLVGPGETYLPLARSD